ncbi:MAG: V-type ATP synthase subunit I [Anaerovoracaceae bacterium]|jgi:V/A-type H+-transporting ATPase subunit I
MSIVKMKKLSVIGLSSTKKDLVESLMRLGVVEISEQSVKLSDEKWNNLVTQDADEGTVAHFDARISKVSQALDTIEKYQTEKKPLITTRKTIQREAFSKVLGNKQAIAEKVEEILKLIGRLNAINTAENKAEASIHALTPWVGYNVPLEIRQTKDTEIIMGIVPSVVNVEQLQKELAEKVQYCTLDLVGSDAEQHYLSMICLKKSKAQVDDVLRQYGFSRILFSDLEGTASENIAKLQEKLNTYAQEKVQLEKEITQFESEKENIQYLYDGLIIKRDQAAIRNNLLVTKKTFYLDGWVPSRAAKKVEELLKSKGCYYQIEDPAKDEETPVLMQNGRFSESFEAVTKLYALPDSRGIDATPFFSLSYAVFFGMMLSDAAYGLLLTIATAVLLKKFSMEGMMRQLMKMLFYCGIATVFWGVLFGGYFGDIVTVVAKTFFNAEILIPPLWFNPLDDPMKLLIFSFILGGLHLFLGMGLDAYLSIRDGRPFDAFCDTGLWYILIIGLVLLITGFANPLGMWMSIIGAVGILVTGGRHNKGIGKITGGLGSLYGITGYLSDVLSYSRLLALGLATGVIASVVNTLGSLAGGGIIGAIVLVVVFIVGHGYNIAINALGAFVHSCRLEYVEFFGKFYMSGGEAFSPFEEKTKYVKIVREEN